MRNFTNKKTWKKILIVILIVMFFQIFIPKPTHAIPGDVLLEPITNLFANLGDGIMDIMQKTFMNMDTSGAWVETSSNLWLKILLIAVAIIAATIAVIATIYSGGAALAIFMSAVGAVVKIGIGAAVAYFAVDTLHFAEGGFFLPEYQLTPQAIFQNEILAFDVNFFNPKEDKTTKVETQEVEEDFTPTGNYTVNYDAWIVNLNKNDKINVLNSWTGKSKEDAIAAVKNHEGYNSPANTDHDNVMSLEKMKKLVEKEHNDSFTMEKDEVFTTDMQRTSIQVIENTYPTTNEEESGHYKVKQSAMIYSEKRVGYIEIIETFYNGWIRDSEGNVVKKYDDNNKEIKKETKTETKTELSSARQLQPIIASWYKAFRNIALVALLSILVYVGIRITISSTASDKAKYKQMIIDWVVALCLVFLMHYIMSFAVTINEKIINVVSSINTKNLGSVEKQIDKIKKSSTYKKIDTKNVKGKSKNGDESLDKNKGDLFDDDGVELFVIEGEDAKNAYKVLVGDTDNKKQGSGGYSSYYNQFSEDHETLIWKANDFMVQARLLGQNVGDDEDSKSQTAVQRAGYNIIYVVLVIFTVLFCFTYLRRVIYMAFLTIIAPLVAITYPIDKMNDGKAQAFNMWLKEYIFNLLIQPMHLVLYTVLVGSAMKFAATNIFYAVVALGFMMPAEKLLRRFFGFEKAQTPGMFAGPAGAALMMSGLSKLMHRAPSKGNLGPGQGNNKDTEDEEKTAPWRDKNFDATQNLIGTRNEDTNLLNNNEENNEGLRYHPALNEEQRDELQAEGIEPGNQEYNQYLRGHGIDPNEQIGNGQPERNNIGNRQPIRLNTPPRTNTNDIPRRKRSIRRAIGRATRTYGKNLGKGIQRRYKQKGTITKRAIRMAGGVAAAGTLAAAGGIIGITTGDTSKTLQYMTAGAAGGYTLGKGAVNRVTEGTKGKLKGTGSEARKGYYGDDYKKVEQEKYKKAFKKEEENLRKIEEKLKVERKEAKEIMKNNIDYYLDHEIDNIDDAIATYRLEREGMSREQAVATAQYANQVMNGEDTRTMTAKRKKEYKDTFIPKFQQQGSRNAEEDVDRLFTNVDKFHKFKN